MNRRRLPLRLGPAALALCAAACGGTPPAPAALRSVLVTEAPAEAGGEGNDAVDPGLRYPAGSRVLRIELGDAGAGPLPLSEGFAAAGGAVASPDGTRVLFVGKRGEADAYALWTCAPDGADQRLAVTAPGDVQAADFLPDGRFVFSASFGEAPAGTGQADSGVGYELFVAAEGGAVERITFTQGAAVDPAVLRDGRIVYVGWKPDAGNTAPDGGDRPLFTVHPDGTGVTLLHGPSSRAGGRTLPRQGRSGDVVFVARRGAGKARVESIDWRAPAAESHTIEPPGEGEPLAAAPAPGDGWLVARGSGLQHVRSDGSATELLRSPPGRGIRHVTDASPRPPPQGQLSSVKPGTPYGTLLGIDARPHGTDGAAGATHVRLRTPKRKLGEVALAADGSFHVRVPPDTPLFLDVLDAGGGVLSGTTTPFWVRPREVRGCVGCHEEPDVAPPNRAPLAGLLAPVTLPDAAGTGR